MEPIPSVNITGDGQIRCAGCHHLWPAYYPSCPTCESVEFYDYGDNPFPIPYAQQQLEEIGDMVHHRVAGDVILGTHSYEIITHYHRRGFFLHKQRGGCSTVQIVQRHHFASHLKRMAVVVHTEEQFYAFVKGAPETIRERLNDTPAYYVSTYKRYTLQGSRVLALAYKPLPDMTVSEARNLDREVVESGLTFAGFAVFNCPIKGDSANALLELKKSSHDLISYDLQRARDPRETDADYYVFNRGLRLTAGRVDFLFYF